MNFSLEILQNILKYVDYNHLIKTCVLVNKEWNNIVQDKHFLTQICEEKIINFPKLSTKLTNNEFILCKNILSCSLNNDSEILIKVDNASSMDNSLQHPAFTLIREGFWSSKGTEIENTDDFLQYSIEIDSVLLSKIKFNFFKAYWLNVINPTENKKYPIFSSKSLSIDIFDNHNKIIYKGNNMIVEHSNKEQILTFEKPIFLQKNYKIKINFKGKLEKQTTDMKYYCCIENLRLHGSILPYRIKNNNLLEIISFEEFKKDYDDYKLLLEETYIYYKFVHFYNLERLLLNSFDNFIKSARLYRQGIEEQYNDLLHQLIEENRIS